MDYIKEQMLISTSLSRQCSSKLTIVNVLENEKNVIQTKYRAAVMFCRKSDIPAVSMLHVTPNIADPN